MKCVKTIAELTNGRCDISALDRLVVNFTKDRALGIDTF